MLDTNPLLNTSVLPPFSMIRAEHLVPAVEHIIAKSQTTVAGIIASQTSFPTWDDLVLAMDEVKAQLEETIQIIDVLSTVHTHKAWVDAVTLCGGLLTQYKGQLAQNTTLYALYQALANSPIAALFNSARKRVLEKILLEYRHAGLHLGPVHLERLRELKDQTRLLEQTFSAHVQQATQAWGKHIENESLLAGLAAPLKQRLASAAQHKNLTGWWLTLHDEVFHDVMLHAQHRPLREEVWIARYTLATALGPQPEQLNNDDVLTRLLSNRHQIARLLGHEHFAQLALQGQMASSTDEVMNFLRHELESQRATFTLERAQLEALMVEYDIPQLEPWDYEYLAQILRQADGVSQDALNVYFPLPTVVQRLVQFTRQLFGVELVEQTQFDRWHPDVRLYQVMEHQQILGYLFIDPYGRQENDGAVEVLTLRNRRMTAEGRPRLPIAVLSGRFAKGDGEQPCLLSHTQLRRLVHEFGHCLQHLLTGQGYRDISGIGGMSPDAIEFASQIMEQWCFSDEFLVWMSAHYQTQEAMPADAAQRLTRVVHTQTSWATANVLLLMLFDIEVHRTQGDGRSPHEVFDALNTEVGHLKWPRDVSPYNSNGLMASPHVARGYSYKWSGVLASQAFEQFSRRGLFDAQTGQAFRDAFFTYGDARSLRDSMEAFLGADKVDRFLAPSAALLRVDNTQDVATLMGQLTTSQQQMIELNDALPRPADIAAQHLKNWFKTTFPALADSVAVQDVSVRTVRETLIPLAERVSEGPLFSRTIISSAPLDVLFWQAAAGRLSTGELFLNLQNIEIVHQTGSTTQAPAALNSNDAKSAFERLLVETRPLSFERQWEHALEHFWSKAASFTQNRPVNEWLAVQLSHQIMTQANLHALDGTLQEPLHHAVTDYALSAPEAEVRASLLETVRPGVYTLAYTPQRWRVSLPVRNCVVFTARDNDVEQGAALLWRLGEPLEVFYSLAQLKASLKEGGDAIGELKHQPLPGNFLVQQVMALRQAQKTAVLQVLSEGPNEGESVNDWIQRVDEAADLGDRLDLAVPMNARQLKQSLSQLTAWLHSSRHATGKDRVAWWKACRAWQQAVTDAQSLPSDPVTLATPEAIQAWTRTELERLIKEKYPPADPDRVFLTIEKRIVDPHAPSGSSVYGSGVALSEHKGIIFDRRSLTQWAMSNMTPDESNARDYLEEGPLNFDAIRDLVKSANVGVMLDAWIIGAARRTQTLWMSLKATQMRVEVLAAHLSGDLKHDASNTRLNLVLAALDGRQPQERSKVNDQEVVVYQIKWGSSTLRDIVAFGVKNLKGRPSLTLYTPGAPDARVFRDADGEAFEDLMGAVVTALTTTREMTLWLISKLPLSAQAEQLASLESKAPERPLGEKIKQFVLDIFSPLKFRVNLGFPAQGAIAAVDNDLIEALYETHIVHARDAANVLTVSHAERDSEAAQVGRSKGLVLVLGMISIPQVNRLGGLLGRAIIPTMIGGAAVVSIKDEGGSGSQWLSDFIGAMGEVVAEAGEDLIMSRASGRRGNKYAGKRYMTLTTLPRMVDPSLRPFLLEGFDGSGLQPEGRNLYRGRDGQGYVKLDGGFYKTTVQGGERFVYSPRNISNRRTVVWENGRWQVEAPNRLLGGGPVMSLFRAAETPQQKKYNALLEGYLVDRYNPPSDMVREAASVIGAMPQVLAQRVLDESIIDARVSGIEAYRSLMKLLNRQRSLPPEYRASNDTLVYKLDVWSAVHSATRDFETSVPGLKFSDVQKVKIFDMALPYRNAYYETTGMNIAAMPDNATGAVFIGITPLRGKKRRELDKINKDYNDLALSLNPKIISALQTQFPGQGPESMAALERYLAVPENVERHRIIARTLFREEMQARDMPGLLTEVRNKRIPYFVVIKGKAQQKIMVATAEDIDHFSQSLIKYTEPFDIQAVTQTATHKVTGKLPAASTTSTTPAASEGPATDRFSINVSPLAEAQMAYDSFPEVARIKMTSIMDDIRAGRVTSKRINGYYWYDMSQLDPGSGRGPWRAAFERKGDTWELQGFYDYHTHRAATVWSY